VGRSFWGLNSLLGAQHRVIASLAAALLVFNGLVAVGQAVDPDNKDPGSLVAAGEQLPEGAVLLPDGRVRLADGTIVSAERAARIAAREDGLLPGSTKEGKKLVKKGGGSIAGPSVAGVTDDEIEVVYYWKGERTMTSSHIGGTPAEGANLDEALAFRMFLHYLNKHANDPDATFFGRPYDLHGRRLVGTVIEAGNGDFSYATNAEKIAKELKPFAAISSHGGVSTYICPVLAAAGIFNLATYDLGGLGGTLHERTNGFCFGDAMSWEQQIKYTIAYLKEHMKTGYGALNQERVYGVIYAEYPGLKDVGMSMVKQLKEAGIPIALTRTIPADLATSQTQASGIVGDMREAGVNTLIMPDANSPLNITPAAQSNGWDPDYYVWPCSGLDNPGMVRLFVPSQWEGAEGLTCYDREYYPDVANNDTNRASEYFAQYQEAYKDTHDGKNAEPPAPAALVYAGLAQLVMGITDAGRDLSPQTFKAAIAGLDSFRYSFVDGITDNHNNILIDFGAREPEFLADVAKIRWSANNPNPGGPPGAYAFYENRRYSSPSQL